MEKDTYLSDNGYAVSCQLNMFIALWKSTTKRNDYIRYSKLKHEDESYSQHTGIQIVTNKIQEDV